MKQINDVEFYIFKNIIVSWLFKCQIYTSIKLIRIILYSHKQHNWPLPGSQKWYYLDSYLLHFLYRGKICVHRHWWRIKAVADCCRGAVTGTSCLGRVDCWLEGGQATGERVSCCNQGVLVCNHCIQIGVDFVQSFKTNCDISVSIF